MTEDTNGRAHGGTHQFDVGPRGGDFADDFIKLQRSRNLGSNSRRQRIHS